MHGSPQAAQPFVVQNADCHFVFLKYSRCFVGTMARISPYAPSRRQRRCRVQATTFAPVRAHVRANPSSRVAVLCDPTPLCPVSPISALDGQSRDESLSSSAPPLPGSIACTQTQRTQREACRGPTLPPSAHTGRLPLSFFIPSRAGRRQPPNVLRAQESPTPPTPQAPRPRMSLRCVAAKPSARTLVPCAVKLLLLWPVPYYSYYY